jgi:hypothetical protein
LDAAADGSGQSPFDEDKTDALFGPGNRNLLLALTCPPDLPEEFADHYGLVRK